MHPKMRDYYEKELNYLRGMGKEFADQFPGVAQRLDLGRFECADPYVERLLEGFAFLTARIQLQMDAEFPGFTQYLLNMVYPHYLSPTPSMTILRMTPDLDGGVTAAGFPLPKGMRLFTDVGLEGQSRCEFRTSRDVTLWPVQVIQVEYLTAAEAGYYPLPRQPPAKAGIRLRLQVANGIPWREMPLDDLVFYLDGGRETTGRVYELLAAHTQALVLQPVVPAGQSPAWRQVLPADNVQPLGFAQEEALLPYTDVSFQGYRLLQEYFAFPERFLFIRLSGLQAAVQRLGNEEALEIVCLFQDKNDGLKGWLNTSNVVLNCVPAINLFPRRADRVHVAAVSREQHVIVDRTHAQDYEVYAITDVVGFDSNLQEQQRFRSFYDCRGEHKAGNAYYTWRRVPHLPPLTKQAGRHYQGSEVYLSLVDSTAAPYAPDLKQLGVSVLCTNRDAPLYTFQHKGQVRFTLDASAPVKQVESLAGPSTPLPAHPDGEHAWRLINHLSLNYLSLLDTDDKQGAAALRSLLRLYANMSEASVRKQVDDGILKINSRPVVRRIPGSGPIAFGRGVEIALQCQESAFDGLGAFLLGSVLEKFFAKYVSINSFTQMSLNTVERGEVMRWPIRTGTTPIL
ncbi:MAG: type VI secretion system baseplate subunit TssF [Candidatus Thiothrix putei]|uniref:Type VI secretion system baseplate subunit TssF n=1 Tax=Candidatus Thiothrix putei TaxID=3080811 RepID=A0AA95HGK3_9GAMM|nr:MAG: type VI secretion system baseplate subunit TssF [Candidatus Thiothrix putei]